MIIRMSTLTTPELEDLECNLAKSAGVLRILGKYHAAAICRSTAMEASQTLVRRASAERVELDRQLTLVERGAYDEPS